MRNGSALDNATKQIVRVAPAILLKQQPLYRPPETSSTTPVI
jgi:hypothetical protein